MNEFQQETLEKILDRLDRILYLMEKPPWDETGTPELLADDEFGLR